MKFASFYTLILLGLNITLYSQSPNLIYGFYGGSTVGGPLPEKKIENSKGRPLFAPYAGFYVKKELKNNFYFQADVAYAMKGASYNLEYTRDTLIDIGIGVVPSFYSAKIGGQMKLHYLDLPISLGYNISDKQSLSFGFFTSFLFSGYDKTNVFIQAGYGDFADFSEQLNNYNSINNQDFGISMKYSIHFYNDFFFLFNLSRSTRSLYSNLTDNNLYHTSLGFAISYVLR